MMTIQNRVKVRIPEIEDGLLNELYTTATDRIMLRLGITLFPVELESIAVEVICAMYNRRYHNGIKQENVDTFSVSFVDNVLAEYEKDLTNYLSMKNKQSNANRGVLRFL